MNTPRVLVLLILLTGGERLVAEPVSATNERPTSLPPPVEPSANLPPRAAFGQPIGLATVKEAPAAANPAPSKVAAPPPYQAPATSPYAPCGVAAVPSQPSPVACFVPDPVSDQSARFWLRGEYLLWWFRGQGLPPLATASPAGTPLAAAGVLGTPGTRVLFGDERVNSDGRSGGRLDLGYWLDPCQTIGVGADYFQTAGLASRLYSGNTLPVVSRPFVDALTGMPSAELVAFPGVLSGAVGAAVRSSSLYGADAYLRQNLYRDADCAGSVRLDALYGYRFLEYAERVGIAESLTPLGPLFAPGTHIAVSDRFATANEFNGGQVGLLAEATYHRWVVEAVAKLALGDMHRTVDIDGFTQVTVPGFGAVTRAGGLLALASNIGHYPSDDFVVIPECGLSLGYHLTPHLQFQVGYTFLYLTSVARAADQIDLVVNHNLLPPIAQPVVGPAQPAFGLHTSDVWVQGINVGMTFTY